MSDLTVTDLARVSLVVGCSLIAIGAGTLVVELLRAITGTRRRDAGTRRFYRGDWQG